MHHRWRECRKNKIMDTQNITCEQCGGTDFYNEDGFYYCNECQTQTQELREQRFEASATHLHDISIAQTHRSNKRKRKAAHKITSWECYNYILLGIVNELMELGADRRLKELVKTLWMKYLRTIRVIRRNAGDPPKLQAFNCHRDASVLYGRKFRRRRAASSKSSSSSQSSSAQSLTSRGEKLRRRRAMVAAEYNQLSSQQSESSTNATKSLRSLRSGSSGRRARIEYTPTAISLMLKMMTKSHLRQHIRDVDNEMTCHPMNYSQFSTTYSRGSEIINVRKLYSIVYAAILMLKDKIQLADVIRFLYEGRLSYNNVWHFFPEEIDKKAISGSVRMKADPIFKHKYMREATARMVKFLSLEYYLPMQNLLGLCRRYCLEMNLPADVEEYCANLILEADPQFNQVANHPLPNYEGRVACLIIVALKLLFGIDNVTEKKFSRLAGEIRDSNPFNFNEWIEFIYYRNLVVCRHHFPSQFFESRGSELPDTFPEFVEEQQRLIDLADADDDSYEKLKKMLMTLRAETASAPEKLDFPVTLTPYTDYLKVLIDSGLINKNGYIEDILTRNFRATNVHYLKRPKTFLKTQVVEERRGANLDVKFVNLFTVKPTTSRKLTENVMVKISKKSEIYDLTQLSAKEDFKAERVEREKYIKQPSEEAPYERHYMPECTYWLNSSYGNHKPKWEEFLRWYEAMPRAFQIIVNELARITNQSIREVMLELQVVESHLCYVHLQEPLKKSDALGVKLTKGNERFW